MYKRIYYLQITTVIYREISEPSQLKMAYAHADICRILQGKQNEDIESKKKKIKDYAVNWCYTKCIRHKLFLEDQFIAAID